MKKNKHGDLIDPLDRFEFYNGCKLMYDNHIERGDFAGYTVILKTTHRNVYIHLEDRKEAFDTIHSHCENYNRLTHMDRLRGDYISNNEWARNDGSGLSEDEE